MTDESESETESDEQTITEDDILMDCGTGYKALEINKTGEYSEDL